MSKKCYTELSKIEGYLERYNYLKLGGKAGEVTFGNERYLNQILYKSPEWKSIRRQVILRDNGCDMGVEGHPIAGVPIIHHMETISVEDIVERNSKVFDMENLITVSRRTHNAIHYGDEELLTIDNVVERTPNDTCPWRRKV